MSARALRLEAFGDDAMGVKVVRLPEAVPGDGEVLVAIEAAAINNSDLRLIRGDYGVRPALPARLGTEGVGRVVSVGPGVDRSLIDRRVLLVPRPVHGTWAERAVIRASDVVPAPESADARQLGMAGVNAATALLLLESAGAGPGDWIAQTAANSAVGQYLAQLAAIHSVKTINVVRGPWALDGARTGGGDVIVVADERLEMNVRAALGSASLRAVLDSVGGPAVGVLARSLEAQGRVVSYGAISGEPVTLDVRHDVVYRGISHCGFWMVNWLGAVPIEDVAMVLGRIAQLVGQGQLRASVERTYGLDEYAEALAHAVQGKRTGKILFVPRTNQVP